MQVLLVEMYLRMDHRDMDEVMNQKMLLMRKI